jgi:hypothetical protein
MKDEEYVFYQDLKEKKVTGYSARKQRSHCGKAGCKLPSDYLTKKEIKNMSGECRSYRLNEPMKFAEFKAMPNDLQMIYITAIREKYNAPVSMIGKMMGIERAHLSKYLRDVLGFGKFPHGNHAWEKDAFMEWAFGIPKAEEFQSAQKEIEAISPFDLTPFGLKPVEPEAIKEEMTAEEAEEVLEIIGEEFTAINPIETDDEDYYQKKKEAARLMEEETRFKKAIPSTGSMTYEGETFNILSSLADLLGNAKVLLSVKWDVVED